MSQKRSYRCRCSSRGLNITFLGLLPCAIMLAVLGITVPLINEVDTVAPAAVLTTVTFTAADGVTQAQAREELLIVVARHFQNTLGIDLS
ncbi:MAG: hypothetical protein QMC37_11565, partial [Flavobacteriales bacterium]